MDDGGGVSLYVIYIYIYVYIYIYTKKRLMKGDNGLPKWTDFVLHNPFIADRILKGRCISKVSDQPPVRVPVQSLGLLDPKQIPFTPRMFPSLDCRLKGRLKKEDHKVWPNNPIHSCISKLEASGAILLPMLILFILRVSKNDKQLATNVLLPVAKTFRI